METRYLVLCASVLAFGCGYAYALYPKDSYEPRSHGMLRTDEIVYLNGGGFVNLKNYWCYTVTKSLVERACYTKEHNYMAVAVNGTYYSHCGVGPDLQSAFYDAKSMGSFYTARIKGRYNCA